MNYYLFFPELKNLTLATTISGAIGTAIFSLAISQPVQAAQLNFSFAPDSELSDPSNVIKYNPSSICSPLLL